MEGRFSCTGWRNSALGVSKIEMILLMLVLCGIGVYVWWMREIPMSIDSKVWSGKFFNRQARRGYKERSLGHTGGV